MAFTFNSKITKNGNIKVSPQILDILGAIPGDRLSVSINIIGRDANERDCVECGECDGCLKISREYLAEAGINPDAPIEIFADEDEGVVVITEADDDE